MRGETHEGSTVAGVINSALDDVPENHVDDKDDEAEETGEEGKDGHEDGSHSAGSSGPDESQDESHKGEEPSDGVDDQSEGQVVQDSRVDVEVTAIWPWSAPITPMTSSAPPPVGDQVLTKHRRP